MAEVQTKFCLFIVRRTEHGQDFTDWPLDNQQDLERLAEAASIVPYVTGTRLVDRTKKIKGKPGWRKVIQANSKGEVSEYYTTEEKFKADLKASLQDDALFDRVYENKRKYIESMLTKVRKELLQERK